MDEHSEDINCIMDEEKKQLKLIIQEYDNVVQHYDNISLATTGSLGIGDKRTENYTKVYSRTEDFLDWVEKTRGLLRRSSVASSTEAKDIISHTKSFRGLGEEEKLKKLYSMLCALYDNWDSLSASYGQRDVLQINKGGSALRVPKFELVCQDYGEKKKKFILKNVSYVIASNIQFEEFDLIMLDNQRENLVIFDIPFPTSLGPNENCDFTVINYTFKQRGIGYKEFQLIFSFEDETSNVYRCVASKNVEDRRSYMLGVWSTQVIRLDEAGASEGINANKPTVFISYNWGSDKTADEVEKRLKPIADVRRDKGSISPWGSISVFMKEIRKTDLVVVIISDKYLKSVACLYEIMQLIKDDNWISHSAFLVEETATGIYKALGQLEYVKYWNDERAKLKNALEEMDPALVTHQAEELKKISLIQLNINDFLKNVADRNNPDLTQALDAIEKRVRSSNYES